MIPRLNLLDKEIRPIDADGGAYAVAAACQREYNKWYQKHVEPLFNDSIEVFSRSGHVWHSKEDAAMLRETPTKRAVLINIEPLKEDTAEDLLRDLAEETLRLHKIMAPFRGQPPILQKALAYIKKKGPQ